MVKLYTPFIVFIFLKISLFSFNMENETNFLIKNFNLSKKTMYKYKVKNLNPKFFNEAAFFGFFTLKIYQKLISSQDFNHCMFHPHCSLYAQLAINKYGLVKGLIMSSSRVLRCNGIGEHYYWNIAPDGKIIDPPEDNYLWKKLKF